MQPIGEIAVEVTGWTEQRLVPIRFAAIGVRARIALARVRFDLGDTDGNRLLGCSALQYTAEQGWRDLEDVTSKEIAARKAQFVNVVHRAIVPVTLGHPNQLAVAYYSQQTGKRWHTKRMTALRRPPHVPKRVLLESRP